MIRFRLGRLSEALIDFDRASEIEPRLQPQNWQRGIALYYAGQYADGRRQFEAHSKVNPEDVENAVWLFMCVAREQSIDAARKGMLSLGDDGRVPMKEIYHLFAGTGTREDVVQAAKATVPDPAEQRRRVFYALLYLALFDDLESKTDAAIDKLSQAVRLAEPGDYMGAVAAFHLNRLRAAEKPAKPAPQP
jgi:lipoprotein NlpI